MAQAFVSVGPAKRLILAALAVLGAILVPPESTPTSAQTTLPAGFADSIALSGLELPTVVAFAPDGRVFVGEKSGLIKLFDNLQDPSPTVFADLRTQVHNYADRGLLGLAVDPQFPARPYIYVLYTRDAAIGGTAPRWGTAGATSDGCPDPPGMTDGCLASGRLARLELSGDRWTGTEQVLIDDWFQQFDSHSIGAIAFGPDGALYASGGDAASWQFVDYGQRGIPRNPNGDPPVPVGGTQTPPTAEGGALRAQDLRTDGDPAGLNGTVIRINPDTGAAMPDNPLIAHPDPNAKRIVAYGLRNPFRLALRPGTRELWVGEVGWRLYEELNIIPDPSAGIVPNFGWPCYDGTRRQDGYDAANLNICEQIYAEAGAVTFGHFQYLEGSPVVSGEPCSITDQSGSGLAFYPGGAYPDEYDGALFFADYTRRCIWFMPPDINGIPDPSRRGVFVGNAHFPVDLKVGPGGDLYYVDIVGGTIRRISYTAGNQAPDAEIEAMPQSGQPPLTVSFDGQQSRDPEGGVLTYAWDLNGDGAFGDSTSPSPSYTYTTRGTYAVRLRVTDDNGLQDVATTSIVVGNTAPTAIIETPAETLRWHTGQAYGFSGRATDPEQGTLAATSLHWTLALNHCSSSTSCHEHPLQEFAGVASGSFTGPDHEYPSYLTLRLTATDAGGLRHTTSRRLDPQAVVLTLDSRPSGLVVALGGESFRTPASRTVIVGSTHSVSAPSPQSAGGRTYAFASWSDGGAQSHLVRAGSSPSTLVATFTETASTLPPGWTSQDIGAVGTPGSSTYSSGVFTVRGAGADVWGTADALQYAYRTLTGDGVITARVTSLQGTDEWVKAGVMIRGSTDPGAPQAFMLLSKSRGPRFQRRTTAGGLTTSTSGFSGSTPYWVRLERSGNVITGSLSPDGVTWTRAASDTFAIGGTVLAGLGVSSHNTSQLATVTFDQVTVTTAEPPPPPPPALPDGWQSGDIGAVGVAGSASENGGTFTVKGAGADVWGTADALHYAYRTLDGDGTITARVATSEGAQAWTKVGVMIRGSAAANAPQGFMLVSNGRGSRFQWRTTAGGLTSSVSGTFTSAPHWVRLTRTGNVITASMSPDGAAWLQVGSDTFAIGTSVLVGLAVSSHDTSQLATATFDSVTVTGAEPPPPPPPPPPTLPDGWQSRDIGAVGVAGSASESGGTFTVRGAGADVWGTTDALHYAYRTLTGDGTITARVATSDGAQAWTKVGVMIRGSADANAPHGFMLVSNGKGSRFQWRTTAGGLTSSASGTFTSAPYWVRLARVGNVITGSISADGSSWLRVGSDTFSMGASVLVGLAVSSHDTSTLATATFDNVSVTTAEPPPPPPPALPDGWQSRDIGAVGLAGSASASGGTFTVKGAGADVWNTADGFHYAYRQLTGDGSITARVSAVSGTHAWTKVGVMMRETLAADSPHAFMLVSTAKGSAFQRRIATGGLSTHTGGPFVGAPYWVRLTRAGTQITASVSSNGTTWVTVGSEQFTMGATIYVGLAVTSHDTTRLATGTIDGVSVR